MYHTVISKRTYPASSSWNHQTVVNHLGRRFKVDIRRNWMDEQSYAHVDYWNGTEWTRVVDCNIAALDCHKISFVAKEITDQDFASSVEALLLEAYQVLNLNPEPAPPVESTIPGVLAPKDQEELALINHAAYDEGWAIFFTGREDLGPWELQRDDDFNTFQDYFAVWEHVAKLSEEDSDLHKRALAFIATHAPNHYKDVCDYVADEETP